MAKIKWLLLVASLVLVTACAPTQPVVTQSSSAVQQGAQDAHTIVAGLQSLTPTISALNATVGADFSKALAAAEAAANSLSGSSPTSTVGEFEAGINAALAAASTLNLSGQAATILAAAKMLAPIVETAFNVVVGAAPAPMPDPVTVAAARMTLLQAARH